MRLVRRILPAFVLAVLVLGAAGCGRDHGVPAPAGEEPAVATPTTPAPTSPAAAKPGPGAAKAAALAFMGELGMRDPVAGSFRATGSATGEVTIHPRREDGRPLDRPTTWVQLHRYTNGWVVTGARARNAIEVEQPRAFARISSPVTVSGLANAYEGTVLVAVLEDRRGPDRVLGKGFVTGGAVELAPFSGRIAFGAPSADAGWLVFSGGTGVDDGIFDATAVRVRFA
jgi:hypothetical protein